MGGHGPPARPRMRPSMPTSIAQLPILELPEPSPHSSSLLDTQLRGRAEPAEAEEEEEFVGGTSMLETSAGARQTFVYAASAPATMLWGPTGHGMGSGNSHMGGRTPSRTLLEALTSRDTANS